MKKIISIICVVAMMLSFAITASATENIFALTLKSQDANTAVYELSVNTSKELETISIVYDMKDAITNCGIAAADITAVAGSGITGLVVKVVPAQKLISVKRSYPEDLTKVTGSCVLATITITTTNMTKAFNFDQASGNTTKNFAVSAAGEGNITANVTFPTATVGMFVPTPAGPEYGIAAECAYTWTTAKSETDALTHTFTNVAVAEATFSAAADAKEAGFVFAKEAIDATYGEELKVLDATSIAGNGNVEYAVVMFNVPDGVKVFAKPYYYAN